MASSKSRAGPRPVGALKLSLIAVQDPATPGALNRKMMQKIVNVEYTFPATPEMSRECKDFISKIFVKDPKERIRTIDMRRHPW